MKSKYNNGNIFTEVAIHKYPRHKFNLGHFVKLTMNHGLAVPFLSAFVVPGDRVDCNTFGRIQLQPLATSSMQNIKCYFRYFYVPFRLLWDEWDKFITQDESETSFDNPYYTAIGGANSSSLNILSRPGLLADYLDYGFYNEDEQGKFITYNVDTTIDFNIWKFQAYHLIWDYYFRDENLQDPTTIELKRGNNTSQIPLDYLTDLLPVAYEKDYFTTALPWPQKGDPVNLSAFVVQNIDNPYIIAPNTIHLNARLGYQYNNSIPQALLVPEREAFPEISTDSVVIDPKGFSTSLNINDLRYSNALQRFLERKALGGSRPSEFYLSMYGVQVDDLRIGQPLYLGGGFVNVSITDIASTVETKASDGATLPQGTLAGNGKAFPAVSMNNPYYCQEFGVIMGIMYMRPELNYMQGLPKELTLKRPLDYYNPLFAHLGEEPVMKSELVVKNGLNNTEINNNDDIFGYQSRYAYLKHMRNTVHGDFKSTLSSWLLSAHFPQNVQLNDDFIEVDQNYDIFAIDSASDHHYLVELYNDFQKESSMPNHVIPSL